MPKGKKKFIDKKKSVTFHLVHRSQQDPLVADEKAPQHVLVAAGSKKKGKTDQEEEQKFGVFFDDDYDYLQHLRDPSKQSVQWIPVESGSNSNAAVLKRKSKSQDDGDSSDEEVYKVERPKQLVLPSSVFASEVEEDVGLLNKAAPQSGLRLDLDPDIVAAMDEDFDFDDPDNELEDNFMELANASGASDDDDDDDGSVNSDFNMSGEEFDEDGSVDADSESRDKVGNLCQFEEEETKSRFTEYSMTSSVIRRNQQLSLLDHRFEKMFEAYDENEIGALDCDEIEGYVPTSSEMLLQCAAEFEKDKQTEAITNDGGKLNLNTSYESDSEEDLRNFEVRGGDDDEKWDCQSILSTYSNIYNRPKLISERNSNPGKIRISRKTGIPLGVFDSGNEKLTVKALAKLDAEQGVDTQAENVPGRAATIISNLSTLSIRPKDETPEERKERKKLVKEYRKERICERKANTAAFKEEKKRQEKIILNNKKNIPTVHIV